MRLVRWRVSPRLGRDLVDAEPTRVRDADLLLALLAELGELGFEARVALAEAAGEAVEAPQRLGVNSGGSRPPPPRRHLAGLFPRAHAPRRHLAGAGGSVDRERTG
jgi:hypothetical protein